MKVYKIYPNDSYTEGCALIAANSTEEAVSIFCKDDYNKYAFDYYSCECEIIENLEYNTEKPVIILDTIYME